MGLIRDKFSKKGNDDWVEWLRDDEPPQDVKATIQSKPRVIQPASAGQATRDDVRRSRLQRAGSVATPSVDQDDKTPSVSIHISLPEFHLPKFNIPYKTISYWGAVGLVTIGVSIGARALVGLLPEDKTNVAVKGAQTDSPSFTPVAPSDKPELAQGSSGGATTSYDPTRQLYSYTDTYLSGQITVSQQSLPEAFKDNNQALADVAATIGATSTFETAFGIVYIATSSNDTSQRLVFTHKNLLILMESNKKYDNEAWKYYIENLR